MTLFDLMFTDCTHFRKVCERLWRYEWHQNITRNDLFTLKIDGKVYHAMSKYQAYWIWAEDFDISFCVAFDHWCQRFLWRGDWALGSASIHSRDFPLFFNSLSLKSFCKSWYNMSAMIWILYVKYCFTYGELKLIKIL